MGEFLDEPNLLQHIIEDVDVLCPKHPENSQPSGQKSYRDVDLAELNRQCEAFLDDVCDDARPPRNYLIPTRSTTFYNRFEDSLSAQTRSNDFQPPWKPPPMSTIPRIEKQVLDDSFYDDERFQSQLTHCDADPIEKWRQEQFWRPQDFHSTDLTRNTFIHCRHSPLLLSRTNISTVRSNPENLIPAKAFNSPFLMDLLPHHFAHTVHHHNTRTPDTNMLHSTSPAIHASQPPPFEPIGARLDGSTSSQYSAAATSSQVSEKSASPISLSDATNPLLAPHIASLPSMAEQPLLNANGSLSQPPHSAASSNSGQSFPDCPHSFPDGVPPKSPSSPVPDAPAEAAPTPDAPSPGIPPPPADAPESPIPFAPSGQALLFPIDNNEEAPPDSPTPAAPAQAAPMPLVAEGSAEVGESDDDVPPPPEELPPVQQPPVTLSDYHPIAEADGERYCRDGDDSPVPAAPSEFAPVPVTGDPSQFMPHSGDAVPTSIASPDYNGPPNVAPFENLPNPPHYVPDVAFDESNSNNFSHSHNLPLPPARLVYDRGSGLPPPPIHAPEEEDEHIPPPPSRAADLALGGNGGGDHFAPPNSSVDPQLLSGDDDDTPPPPSHVPPQWVPGGGEELPPPTHVVPQLVPSDSGDASPHPSHLLSQPMPSSTQLAASEDDDDVPPPPSSAAPQMWPIEEEGDHRTALVTPDSHSAASSFALDPNLVLSASSEACLSMAPKPAPSASFYQHDPAIPPVSWLDDDEPPPPPADVPPYTEEDKRRDRRKKIAEEILSTEVSYVKSLEVVIEVFIPSLSTLLPEADIDGIFRNIKEIHKINESLLGEIRSRLEVWEAQERIGTVFVEFAPSLSVYSFYANTYDRSMDILNQVEKHPPVAGMLKQCQEHSVCQSKDIRSFLIMPIQRIPRYKMLLDDLVKHSPSDHPDAESLTLALFGINAVAKEVNETIRRRENLERVLRIQKEFVGNVVIATNNRAFVHEGTLVKICRKAPKRFWFFLFSDVLIYCSKTTTGGYILHRKLAVRSVEDVEDTLERQNVFQIISDTKSFNVVADSASEKARWMEQLTEVFGSASGPGAALWVADDDVKRCMICETVFSVVKRRHHCRNCGNCICSSCSTHKMPLASLDAGQVVRVCDTCFEGVDEAQRSEVDTVLAIQNKFVGKVALVAPGRELVRQGPLVKVCRKERKEFWFFVFSDILVYAKSLPNNRFMLNHILKPKEIHDVADSVSMFHGIAIVSPEKSFTVLASSDEEKKSWKEDLEKLTDRRKQRMSMAADVETKTIWDEDSSTKTCPVCSVAFSLTKRRHHCRRCGGLCCAQCSTNKHRIAGSLERVCDVCYDELRNVDENSPNKGGGGVYVRGRNVAVCMNCSKAFTAFRRRQHCPVCDRVLCAPCIPSKLPTQDHKIHRVCEQCYFNSFSQTGQSFRDVGGDFEVVPPQ